MDGVQDGKSVAELGLPFGRLGLTGDRRRSEPWWGNAATIRFMITEYLKYMYAQVRMRVAPTAGVTATG